LQKWHLFSRGRLISKKVILVFSIIEIYKNKFDFIVNIKIELFLGIVGNIESKYRFKKIYVGNFFLKKNINFYLKFVKIRQIRV
jgi:hypothetical protein